MFLQNLKYAIRSWRTYPGLCLLAVIALALGIGANSTIFSAVEAVLIRPLPFRDPARLVFLFERSPKSHLEHYYSSAGDYWDFKARARTLQDSGCFWRHELNVAPPGGEPERVHAVSISASLLTTLGVNPEMGRNFSEVEDQPNGPPSALITDEFWRTRFGADPGIVGKKVDLDQIPNTIVGVLPAGIRFAADAQIWQNLQLYRQRPGPRFIEIAARLKDGVTTAAAEAELKTIAGHLAAEFPRTNDGWDVSVRAATEELTGDSRPALILLLLSVGLLLLIACGNVANLLLAQALARRREIAVRSALGATTRTLVTQFLTESMLLAFTGGLAGLLLALWGVQGIRQLSLTNVPRLDQVSLNLPVLGYTLGLTLVTGIVFGLAPILHVIKPDLGVALKEGDRGSSGGGTHQLARNFLVIAQVTLAVVLVTSAGLLIKSFLRVAGVNPGFESENIITANVSLPFGRYGKPSDVSAFFNRLLDGIAALPGVKAAGATTSLPLQDEADYRLPFRFLSLAVPKNPEDQNAYHRMVSPDFFRSLGTPLRAGRYFTASDTASSQPVVIVNETLARRYWPTGSPLGQRIRAVSGGFGPLGRILTQDPEVVGVVADMKYSGPTKDVPPSIYFPLDQAPFKAMTLVIRTSLPATSLVSALRGQLQLLDPQLPLAHVSSMSQQVAGAVAQPRFQAILLGAFAALALVLGGVGIYGVLSFAVLRRTREIGIRMALGSQPKDVQRLILWQGLKLVSTGLGLGLIGTIAAGRALRSLLYEVAPSDPATYAVVVVILFLVAAVASYIPSWRATKIDPIQALRTM